MSERVRTFPSALRMHASTVGCHKAIRQKSPTVCQSTSRDSDDFAVRVDSNASVGVVETTSAEIAARADLVRIIFVPYSARLRGHYRPISVKCR
jgi:hypothetical protein